MELNKVKRDWIEDILSKYGDLDEVATGQRQISEVDKRDGRKILNPYRNMLLDIEKLTDLDQKNYYLDSHQEIISDLEDIFRKRPITRYLSNHSFLQYTVIKNKLEDFLCHNPSSH